MEQRALITAASNKFFPSLINLLGSIKTHYPDHPPIYIYDLGLLSVFRRELGRIEGIKIIRMPQFVPFWRSCYTWKPYIFKHPLAKLNFYLDAGCQVLKPLGPIFDAIEKDDYFLIYQGGSFADIVPKEYIQKFNLSQVLLTLECLHAGIFGFKAASTVTEAIDFTFTAASEGLALGFSQKESWRNKGVNKTSHLRDCPVFRHDMTLLNIGLRKQWGNTLSVHSEAQYAGGFHTHPEQYIWQMRLGYRSLQFIPMRYLHPTFSLTVFFNRCIIYSIITFKNINLSIKKMLRIVP